MIGMWLASKTFFGPLTLGTLDTGPRFMTTAPDRMFAGFEPFAFFAMPFFTLAGEIMNKSGIAEGLVGMANSPVGWMRGGMAQSNMAPSGPFAGIAGLADAAADAFGDTPAPAMEQAGWSRAHACAPTAAGSIIGPTIPPSRLAIAHGSLASASAPGLVSTPSRFAAGILPGRHICAVCMGVIALAAKRLGLPKGEGRPSFRSTASAFRDGGLGAALRACILGSILGGAPPRPRPQPSPSPARRSWATAICRALSWRDLHDIAVRTARITEMIFSIIASATTLGWWRTLTQPRTVATAPLSAFDNLDAVIGLILPLTLGIGLVMDINAALIILAPILAPVLAPLTLTLGTDPVHARIMIILALNISLTPPPAGARLFALAPVTGETVEAITRHLRPFIPAEVTILIVIAFWPDLASVAPRLPGLRRHLLKSPAGQPRGLGAGSLRFRGRRGDPSGAFDPGGPVQIPFRGRGVGVLISGAIRLKR